MEAKLRGILANAIDVEPDALTDESSPDTMPEWDSFAHLNMVAALEQEYGISLTLEEVIEMQTLSKIREVTRENSSGDRAAA